MKLKGGLSGDRWNESKEGDLVGKRVDVGIKYFEALKGRGDQSFPF